MLLQTIRQVEQCFSDENRQKNVNNENFSAIEYKILSESVAIVTMQKQPGNKLCLFLFYFINANNGYWSYFVPTDSHLLGFGNKSLLDDYVKIENYNKSKN